MIREGSAFLRADINDLNSFRVGMSAIVPWCLTRLNQICCLILGEQSMMGAGFLYSKLGPSSSPASAARFLECIICVKRLPAISVIPESVDHDMEEVLGAGLVSLSISIVSGSESISSAIVEK